MLISTLLTLAIASAGQQKIDPATLVGTWVAGGDSKLRTLTFGGDGKFHSVPKDKNSSEFLGTYTVSSDTITIEPHGVTATIKELGGDKLMLDTFGEFKRQRAGGMGRGPAIGGFRIGAPPAPSGKWAVVKSDKGDFTVEMPGPPNGRQSGGGGGFEENSISFQNRSMELIATAIEGPMEVPEGQMAKYLEVLRNRAVERYGKDLKVVSEKPARVGDLDGQEFVVALDRMGVGPMNISGRAFAKGKLSYVLLAIPAARGQDLGPDAQKFLASFTPAGAAGKAAKPAAKSAAKGAPKGVVPSAKAAPPAKKAEASAPNPWGTQVDPDSDVKVRKSDASLTMEIPAKAHLLAPERGVMNAPRVLAPVVGDFAVSVHLSGGFNPVAKSTVKGLSSRQAGGLIVWKDAKNYLVFQHRASLDDGNVVHQAVLEELVGGDKGVTNRQPASDGATFFRLEREGRKLTASFSEDGKEWKALKPVDAAWLDGEVKVGIVAVNTSPTALLARFDNYSLTEK